MLGTEGREHKLPGLASSSVPWERLLENTQMAETVWGEHPLGFPVYGLGRGILT